MTQRKRYAKRSALVGLIMAALLLTPFAPIGAAEATSDVDRTLPDTGACGKELRVTLGLDWGPDRSGTTLMFEEEYPSGWAVTQISHGGSVETPGKAKWFLEDPAIDQVTYRLAIPANTVGDFVFDGEYRDDTMSSSTPNAQTSGDDVVTVACPEADVSRAQLPSMTCGETFTVAFDIEWHNDAKNAIMIEETPPSGWQPSNPSHDGNLSTSGQVKWFLDDASITQVTYQVTVPADAVGVYGFDGVFRDETMGAQANAPVAGDTSADVSCGASVNRGGLGSTSECGDTFTVVLDLQWTATQNLFIEESYPTGWSAANPSDGGSLQTEDHVKWFLSDPGIAQVTYELTIPSQAAGVFSFAGEFRDDTLSESEPSRTILGQTQKEVSCDEEPDDPPCCQSGDGEGASAQRTAPSTAHPQSLDDQSFTVTVGLAWDDAGIVQLRETIPSPGIIADQVSNGGSVVGDTIQWDLTDPTVTAVSYRLTVSDTANLGIFGQRSFSGTVMDDIKDSPANLAGDQSFDVTHRFDSDQDCVFSDNNLFTVIDRWKVTAATDNELFSGIDAWKLLPSSYC